MREAKCSVPEERWIDWHLGRLSDETADALRRHLDVCPECEHAFRYWERLLGQLPIESSGAVAAGQTPENAPEAWSMRPAPWVRLKLRARMIRRSLRVHLAKKPYALAAAGMLAAVLAGAIWLGQHLTGGKAVDHHPAVLPPLEYARIHEPIGMQLMEQPDTFVFTGSSAIVPGWPNPASGGRSSVIVWANPRTGEIFVLMDGLLPVESRDVQVWGLTGEEMTNLGLIQFHQWQGHLYSQIYRLRELEELFFTIEPKGGSQKPTSPETAKLRLFSGS